MAEPIGVEDYLEQLLAGLQPLAAVQLPLADCLGLVTASTVTAEVAVPPFTNSAMDGFAVHAADVAPASEALKRREIDSASMKEVTSVGRWPTTSSHR